MPQIHQMNNDYDSDGDADILEITDSNINAPTVSSALHVAGNPVMDTFDFEFARSTIPMVVQPEIRRFPLNESRFRRRSWMKIQSHLQPYLEQTKISHRPMSLLIAQ